MQMFLLHLQFTVESRSMGPFLPFKFQTETFVAQTSLSAFEAVMLTLFTSYLALTHKAAAPSSGCFLAGRCTRLF